MKKKNQKEEETGGVRVFEEMGAAKVILDLNSCYQEKKSKIETSQSIKKKAEMYYGNKHYRIVNQ